MAGNSSIEWTETTWNPTTGCTKVSSGCKNCYAERLSKRLKAMGLAKYRRNFEFAQHDNEIARPLHWKKPRKIFVNSMSDLFHEESKPEFVGACFDTMLKADWHVYQILTKRPDKMAGFSRMFAKYFRLPKIPPHIWMGTSVEDNSTIYRIGSLRKVKCCTRFVSFEPLLEGIRQVNLSEIDWAIIGGESGHRYRQVQRPWVEGLIRQCRDQGVKVFFKQWGGHRPKSNGRLLRGRLYDEYPSPEPVKSAAYLRQIEAVRQAKYSRRKFLLQ